MNKLWIYLIHRSGYVTELHLTLEQYQSVLKEWKQGGLIVAKSMNGSPLGINAVDLSNVLPEDEYEAWIDSANPVNFIRKGCWYDRKDRHRPFRYEPWKQKEMDKRMKLEAPKEEDEPIDPEVVRKNMEKMKADLVKSGVLSSDTKSDV